MWKLRPSALILICLLTSSTVTPSSSRDVTFDDSGACSVRMRGAHHRRARSLAPGSQWIVEIGVEVPFTNLDMWVRVPIIYNLNQLFAGRGIDPSAKQIAKMVAKEMGMAGGQMNPMPMGRIMSNVAQSLSGRSLSVNGKLIAEDQLHTYRMLESSLGDLGVEGKECLLRAICEMQETKIAEWTYFGEMLTNFLTPKLGDYSFLADYQAAYDLGSRVNSGSSDCQTAYQHCPMSIFNFIPAIVGQDMHLNLGNLTELAF